MKFGMQFPRSADPQFSNTQQIDPDFLHCFVLIDLFLANEHAKILTCVLSDWTLQFCFVHRVGFFVSSYHGRGQFLSPGSRIYMRNF